MPRLKKIAVFALGGLVTLGFAQWSVAQESLPAQMMSESIGVVEVDQLRAIVDSVDLETRIVGLRMPDGEVMKMQVSEEARNLAQVRAGDQVTVKHLKKGSIELIKGGGGAKGTITTAGAARTDLGQKPGFSGYAGISVFTMVEGVDRENHTVKLRSANGNLVEVKARNPERLERVKVGDSVKLSYTESVAISVDTVP